MTLPASTVHELTTRMVPPTATTRVGSSSTGLAITVMASGSRIESASVTSTYGWRAKSMPQLTASARPPFALRTRVIAWAPVDWYCSNTGS